MFDVCRRTFTENGWVPGRDPYPPVGVMGPGDPRYSGFELRVVSRTGSLVTVRHRTHWHTREGVGVAVPVARGVDTDAETEVVPP